MYELKNYRGVICNDTEELWKIWRRIDLSIENWHMKFNKFWREHSEISKICTSMGCVWSKYIMFELKNYRVIIFHDTGEWFKNWRKTELWFWKWDEEFGKFSPEHWKVAKLLLWWNPFIQSRKYMSLKLTGELCVMTLKNDAKFEEELTCQFKTDMTNLINFDSSTEKSQIFSL